MSVIPLALGQTVVTTKDEFDHSRGRHGTALLIEHFDESQLLAGSPNLRRIGSVYKDHRDGGRRDVADNGSITLLPGGAIIIETEEDLHVPQSMFGYIVPRVKWLQEGVSNTLSKVDPGYNGHLLVTLFNLGKKTATLSRRSVSAPWSFIKSALTQMSIFMTNLRRGSWGRLKISAGCRRSET